jgi:tetratricopeptide (TPR) repeat protein
MKKIFFTALACLSFFNLLHAQINRAATPEEQKEIIGQIDSTSFLRSSAMSACKCIDSISLTNKGQKEISQDVKKCIDEQVLVYEGSMKIFNSLKNPGKNNSIELNADPESNEYKRYYYDLERWLLDSCASLQKAMKSDDTKRDFSVSTNTKAMDEYNKGITYFNKEDFADALPYFKKAVEIDPDFAFAWDNLGLCYRKTNNYDDAIKAYQKSLEIDPKGPSPLQNIAVAYEFKKEYEKELDAYQRLAAIYPDDPETFYGIGRVYILKNDSEKALDNMCKAYNLYIKINSPYRTDAEKNIQMLYQQMKKDNKEDVFNKILKDNNINPN